MIERVPWIGRVGWLVFAVLGVGGCAQEFNPQRFHGEADALSNVVPLTQPTGPDAFERAGEAQLSPDGRWVAFRGIPRGPEHTVRGEPYGLFVAHVRWAADGGGDRHIVGLDRPIRVTRVGVRCGGACFSPDGFSLAFAAAVDASPRGVMRLYRVDNWEQAVAMTDVARGVDLAQHPVSPGDLSVTGCQWSPNGKSIVVTASDGGPPEMFSLRSDGSHPIRLGLAGASAPAISPDGKRLAYRIGQPSRVMVGDVVLDVAGDLVGIKNDQPLTHEPTVVSTGPCWLADGRHLVYATDRHGNLELYVMRADDGTAKTRLTVSPGVDVLPTASADGHQLIWTAERSTGPQLWAADLTLPPGG